MIRVCFFAQLREAYGDASLELHHDPRRHDVAALRTHIAQCHRGTAEEAQHWRQLLGAANIICAVNHQVVRPDHPLRDGDEVAFYPPVTGG